LNTTFTEIDSLILDIKTELEKPLPGISAQSMMISQFQRNIIEYFNYNQNLREAAVLVILYNDNKKLKTILIERVQESGPHSGQIAFPGGRRENSDFDLIDTALREADEEIGIKVARESIIGKLTKVEIPVSGFSVLPIVCNIDFIPNLKRCENEVDSIIIIDILELLKSKAHRNIIVRDSEIEVPCYIFENKIIWGATAMVLSEFEEIINRITKSD
jgi:8-oxo-dGTP pyrophosphatase MutT (NUDIX family)